MAVRKTKTEEKHLNANHSHSDGQDVIHLSAEESIQVVNSLRYPPKPTQYLREAMREFYHKV